jgi:hypothetical protein
MPALRSVDEALPARYPFDGAVPAAVEIQELRDFEGERDASDQHRISFNSLKRTTSEATDA